MYTITGEGRYIGCDQAGENAVVQITADLHNVAHNFVEYEKLVSKYAYALDGFIGDFWNHIFYYGSRDEILFWINYPQRKLRLFDICRIHSDNEDLFQIGINRTDLNLEYSQNAIDVCRNWPVRTPERIAIYQNRANQIRALIAP